MSNKAELQEKLTMLREQMAILEREIDALKDKPEQEYACVIPVNPNVAMGELQAIRGGWQPIETAPRDGTPILAYCDHGADPYILGDGRYLTDYGANAEGLSHVEDGVNIIVWHGPIDEIEYTIPPWWCAEWDDEVAANPTHWMPLPPIPGQEQEQAK